MDTSPVCLREKQIPKEIFFSHSRSLPLHSLTLSLLFCYLLLLFFVAPFFSSPFHFAFMLVGQHEKVPSPLKALPLIQTHCSILLLPYMQTHICVTSVANKLPSLSFVTKADLAALCNVTVSIRISENIIHRPTLSHHHEAPVLS